MSTDSPTPADIAPKAPEAAPVPTEPETQQPETDGAPIKGEDALGDPGKKALDRMKADLKAAKAEARTAADERDRLKAAAEGREAEWEAEKTAREEADRRFTEKYLKAEIRAAATGKLNDPADALRYLDMTEFQVSDDGEVDADAISSAIEALVTQKPYLAAQGSRFQGTPDAGTRKESGPAQLTRQDLKTMTPEAITEARAKGQLNGVLGITPN